MKKVRVKDCHNILVDRIEELCKEKDYSYYMLSYRSTVPLTTLMHIKDGSSKSPGVLTIAKICDGLEISLSEFFDTEDFRDMLKE